MFRVIALDPGGTTGWATYTAEKMLDPVEIGVDPSERQYEYYEEKWACGELGPEPHHSALWAFLELQAVSETVIVCESFEFRQDAARKRNNLVLVSMEYIGIVKLFVSERKGEPNAPSLVMQTAGKVKPFSTDDKLEKLNLLQKPISKHKHENDAYRHLIHYLINAQRRHDIVARLR